MELVDIKVAIQNRIIELDDLLYEPHLLTREDQAEMFTEFDKLNKALVALGEEA